MWCGALDLWTMHTLKMTFTYKPLLLHLSILMIIIISCDVCFGWMVGLTVQSNQFSIWRGGDGFKFISFTLSHASCLNDASKMDLKFWWIWLKSNRKYSQINLESSNVKRMIEESEKSELIELLSRIFFSHVFLVQTQKKCHCFHKLASITFHPIENAFIHFTVLFRMVMHARGILQFVSTPNNRFGVGSSRTRCYIFRVKSSYTLRLYVNMSIIIESNRCAPMLEVTIFPLIPFLF